VWDSLSREQLELLEMALRDAIQYREPWIADWCDDCRALPDGDLCVEHLADAETADDYAALLDAVREELAPPPDNVLLLPVARRAQLAAVAAVGEGQTMAQATIVGRAGNDAVLHASDSGVKFATFRLADTPRIRDPSARGGWRDGETVWWNIVAWRGLAENVAASVRKGMPISVIGEIRNRTLPPLEGDAQGLQIQEVHASDVSVSMHTGVVTFQPVVRPRQAVAGPANGIQ
jgi:single-strand DNA-binding protein